MTTHAGTKAASTDLAARACTPIGKDGQRLHAAEVAAIARETPDWTISGDVRTLSRRFEFDDFEAAHAFVERIVAVVRAEDHHPEIRFGWGFVEAIFTTHTVDGLSDNDFICAAKIDALDRS